MSELQYSAAVGARVIVAASRYVGLTEVRSNAKWDMTSTDGPDPVAEELRAEMLRTGWQLGWPYCMAFCEVAWRAAYQGRKELDVIKPMLTAGCLVSWRNAQRLGWTSNVPQIGAIGVMRKGDTEFGHAFLVRAVQRQMLFTVEGNTSISGALNVEADRNGDGVYVKSRQLVFKPSAGLHLLGFILPMTVQ